MRYQVLQHVSFETPGLIAEFLRSRGDSLRTTALYAGESLPAVSDFEGLIIMGGPMSIHDEAAYPWLRAEKQLIAAAIREEKQVLGICLGAQLMAAVCGAKVYPNPVKEIGIWPVKWLDPAFAKSAAGEAAYFHWHGETFDLPAGAVLLASTDACVNQAFRIGDRLLGVQFHPEVTPEMIRQMVEHGSGELVDGPFIRTKAEIGDQRPGKGCMSFLVNWL